MKSATETMESQRLLLAAAPVFCDPEPWIEVFLVCFMFHSVPARDIAVSDDSNRVDVSYCATVLRKFAYFCSLGCIERMEGECLRRRKHRNYINSVIYRAFGQPQKYEPFTRSRGFSQSGLIGVGSDQKIPVLHWVSIILATPQTPLNRHVRLSRVICLVSFLGCPKYDLLHFCDSST